MCVCVCVFELYIYACMRVCVSITFVDKCFVVKQINSRCLSIFIVIWCEKHKYIIKQIKKNVSADFVFETVRR